MSKSNTQNVNLRGQKQDRNANLSAHRLPYIIDAPVYPERPIRLSGPSPPSLQCVSRSVPAAPRSASAPPVKGVLSITTKSRKRILKENHKFQKENGKSFTINNLLNAPHFKPPNKAHARRPKSPRKTKLPPLSTDQPKLPTDTLRNRQGIKTKTSRCKAPTTRVSHF